MDDRNGMCRVSIAGTTYVVPTKEALEIFKAMSKCQVHSYEIVGNTYHYIVRDANVSESVTLCSISDFELIAARALGETAANEKGGS